MQAVNRGRSQYRSRGAVVVFVAIALVLMIGLAALTIDTGNLYVVRTELQGGADASAMAAALTLADGGTGNVFQTARQIADQYARLNSANHVYAGVSNSDVVFGNGAVNSTGKYVFNLGGTPTNAVRVKVRRSQETGNAVQFGLAHIFGQSSKDVSATATAMLQPRDIAVVIDLSLSMSYDSDLFHSRSHLAESGATLPGIQINLRDIWCALNGPAPTFPYLPGGETQTQYSGDQGPAVGAMSSWGSEIFPTTYDPTTDLGLWYVKNGSTTADANIRSSLLGRGYSADEATQLMSGAQDSSGNQWRNRAATVVGLARWSSGRPGGITGGDGDNKVEDNELTWIPLPSYALGWTWPDYVAFASSSSSNMVSTDSRLQWRFGPKTYTNFLLEKRSSNAQTSILWQTPEQPLQAVKDAVQTFVNILNAMQSSDHLSLEVFAGTGRHEINLTSGFQTVADRMKQMQAGHYDSSTNIGGGLSRAIAELTSTRARSNAAKTIILLSDGNPNVDSNGNHTTSGGTAATSYATSQAQQAADLGMRIFTVSVGADASRALMQTIAAIGHGQEFYAHGTPDEYTDQLQTIFRQLGGKQKVMLIE